MGALLYVNPPLFNIVTPLTPPLVFKLAKPVAVVRVSPIITTRESGKLATKFPPFPIWLSKTVRPTRPVSIGMIDPVPVGVPTRA